MDTLALILTLSLFSIFLFTAIFIFLQNPKKPTIWFFSSSMIFGAIYVVLLLLRANTGNIQHFITLSRLFYIPAELGTLLWMLTTFSLRNDYKKLKKSHWILIWIIILSNMIILILLSATNSMTDYQSVLRNETDYPVNWHEYIKNQYILRTIINLVKTTLPIYNLITILKINKFPKNSPDKKSVLNLLAAAILFFLGVMWGVIWHHLNISSSSQFTNISIIQNMLLLPSMGIGAYTLVFYDTLLEQKREIQKEFIVKLVVNFLLAIPYLFLFFYSYYKLPSELLISLITIFTFGSVIVTHEVRELIIQSVLDSLKMKTLKISSILDSDVNASLKNMLIPNLLSSSKLLKLENVKRIALKRNISKTEALQTLLKESIEYFKPESKREKRTLANLKYEILRMIAYEQASESQIMWDLGFDVYTRSVEEKLSENTKPRFPLKDASEYPATSQRSFKRIKKEAIEMLRWKLEEGEK